ncbi:hypothetical protein JW977_00710 [Candidatus Falkowbacteria bacterium]|nr:hypothetical protein [Candidatus Falkowbacteria bacterium]
MKRKMKKLMNSAWEMLLVTLFCTMFFSLYFWGINYLMDSLKVTEWANAPLWKPIGAFALMVVVGVILYRAETNPAYHEQDAKEIFKKNWGAK